MWEAEQAVEAAKKLGIVFWFMQMRSGKHLAAMVRDFKTYSYYLQSLVFHNLIFGIRKELFECWIEDIEGTMPQKVFYLFPKSSNDL